MRQRTNHHLRAAVTWKEKILDCVNLVLAHRAAHSCSLHLRNGRSGSGKNGTSSRDVQPRDAVTWEQPLIALRPGPCACSFTGLDAARQITTRMNYVRPPVFIIAIRL